MSAQEHERQLRKRKNADAQAAFRKKRDEYIATLEEAATNLEAVVQELQRSQKENCEELQQLRQEKRRLQHQLQEQQTLWTQRLQYDNIMQLQQDKFYVMQ